MNPADGEGRRGDADEQAQDLERAVTPDPAGRHDHAVPRPQVQLVERRAPPQRLLQWRTAPDLRAAALDAAAGHLRLRQQPAGDPHHVREGHLRRDGDRKSTRLNSSHQILSYAVLYLKTKTTT